MVSVFEGREIGRLGVVHACNSSSQEVDVGSTAVPLDLSSEFHSQTLEGGRERRTRGGGIEMDCFEWFGLDK